MFGAFDLEGKATFHINASLQNRQIRFGSLASILRFHYGLRYLIEETRVLGSLLFTQFSLLLGGMTMQ